MADFYLFAERADRFQVCTFMYHGECTLLESFRWCRPAFVKADKYARDEKVDVVLMTYTGNILFKFPPGGQDDLTYHTNLMLAVRLDRELFYVAE